MVNQLALARLAKEHDGRVKAVLIEVGAVAKERGNQDLVRLVDLVASMWHSDAGMLFLGMLMDAVDGSGIFPPEKVHELYLACRYDEAAARSAGAPIPLTEEYSFSHQD